MIIPGSILKRMFNKATINSDITLNQDIKDKNLKGKNKTINM